MTGGRKQAGIYVVQMFNNQDKNLVGKTAFVKL
jgi:hypothetical protein